MCQVLWRTLATALVNTIYINFVWLLSQLFLGRVVIRFGGPFGGFLIFSLTLEIYGVFKKVKISARNLDDRSCYLFQLSLELPRIFGHYSVFGH